MKVLGLFILATWGTTQLWAQEVNESKDEFLSISIIDSFKQDVANFDISCRDEEDCLPGVAQVFTKLEVEAEEESSQDKKKGQKDLKTEIGLCTGFLIAPNQLVTNLHCLKDAIADCSQSVMIKFPQMPNFPEEMVGCKKILQNSDLNREEDITYPLDYAVIEIDRPVSPQPLPLKTQGTHELKASDKLDVWSFKKLNDQQSTLIKIEGCSFVYDSFYFPLSQQDPLLYLANCPVFLGSSGGPILNQKGLVSGLIHSGVFNKLSKNELSPYAIHALGTNIECLASSEKCQKIYPDEKMKELQDLEILKFLKDNELFLTFKQKQLATLLEFKGLRWDFEIAHEIIPINEFHIVNQMREGAITLRPQCFLDPELSKSEQFSIETDELFPVFRFQASLDEQGRLESVSNFKLEESPFKLTGNLDDLERPTIFNLSLEHLDTGLPRDREEKVELPLCP